MSGFLGSLLAFIVTISVLVAIHEFGHFWVAQKLGIKVLRFSIGFGTPIWKRLFGKDRTEFVIAAIPLGGYVKMLDEREGNVASEDLPRAFNQQVLWKRSAVLVAGPVFNFLFAIIAYWLMFSYGISSMRPVIGSIEPGSYAAVSGVMPGDEVLKVAGKETHSWDEASIELLDVALERQQKEIEVRGSNGDVRILFIDLRDATDVLDKGGLLGNLGIKVWRPLIPAVIDRVVPGSPAEVSGLQSGDIIIKADNNPVDDWSGWVNYVRERPVQVIVVGIERNDILQTIKIQPRAVEENGKSVGQIGAYVRKPETRDNKMRTVIRYGLVTSAQKAVVKTWDMSILTLRTLWGMLTGHASVANISGPISIAQYAGYSAQVGISSFLKFLAIVSISLGVLNLLPIPVLDGGHLLYNVIEWIKGTPLSEAAQAFGLRVGVAALLGLMSLAFYNDISRLLGTG